MTTSSKGSSRWGSFLQQAVAGVESRLDNILAEGDEAQKPKQLPTSTTIPTSPAAKSESGISNQSTTPSQYANINSRTLKKRIDGQQN